MYRLTGIIWALFLSAALSAQQFNSRETIIDDFEGTGGWKAVHSDEVTVDISSAKGITGNAIRIDYNFTKGTGFGGVQKSFPLDLPANYEFSFWVRAESPSNNFEIKFIDSTGNNVWWVNNRNFNFSPEWKKVVIKKRNIQFAWGPTNDRDLHRIDRIEFTIASYVGGSGTVLIDNLMFEQLPPEIHSWPQPLLSASSAVRGHLPENMLDSSLSSYWMGRKQGTEEVIIDFTDRRELGGLKINWLKDHYAKSFKLLSSDNGTDWRYLYSVDSNMSDLSFIRLQSVETRYLKLEVHSSGGDRKTGINELDFPEAVSTESLNDFLIYCAQNSPPGDYPAYFSRQATYWTITGVNEDVSEALISENGMVEVGKALFSIEPAIVSGDSLYNWRNVSAEQFMGFPEKSAQFDFLPSVAWQCGDIRLVTGVSSYGHANDSSVLDIGYAFENLSVKAVDFDFYLLLRPYQVNPYYQFLNTVGGSGRINTIMKEDNSLIKVDGKAVYLTRKFDQFGACRFDEGNPVEIIRRGALPEKVTVFDSLGLASGIIKYSLRLEAGERTEIFAAVPFHNQQVVNDIIDHGLIRKKFFEGSAYWTERINHVRFNLPSSADRLIRAWKANLVYILINRDNAGIQPGSRSYERSWIRDGSLTSSALLKSGIKDEVRDFIDWYSAYQSENGKVPCVVDFRGPDPVAENDSHGEMIFLIMEYFRFTGDTLYLRSKNNNVVKAVNYIESLTAERTTDHYRNGNDSLRAFYGLVPESISHEGYSAKPMHSYWDDFLTLKGLKDAVEIQRILGDTVQLRRIALIRDEFRRNLYNSLDLAMKLRKTTYIPGCVELGDFDATSTAIALTACGEAGYLPQPQLNNTFDRYFSYFIQRRDGDTDWINYTPYENRIIGAFVMLDQPERAHELIEFLLNDQRPKAWDHWAEVVWKDIKYPGFIGDMPHTWCGSDFINSVRSLFVYEDEFNKTLVVGAGLYKDWTDNPAGMSVENLPTAFGELS